MPNAGESLETYITNLLKSGKENKVIIGEIIDCINKSLQALKILHSFKIIHNDLKLDNICINKKKECRIIDFGTSILYDPTSRYKNTGINAPDYIFLDLDKDHIFNFKRHLHIYSSDEFKEQLILCAKNMPTEEKKYKKNKDNYFKMDLYFFGCMLDNLLYEVVAYNDKDYSFKPKIDCDELKPGGILYEFIVSISNLDYKKRKLLYEIKKQTWLGRLFS
jgi:serine/threonine protein kinase